MRGAAMPFFVVVALSAVASCAKLREKAKPAPSSSAAIAAASISAAPEAKEAPAAAAASAEAAKEAAAKEAAAKAAAVARAKEIVADLEWMVAHDVTQNPAKAGEGDASTKCDAVETQQQSLGDDADPELKSVLERAAALCAFDIPVTTAVEALNQLRFSTSQASRRLWCEVAARELDRARKVKARDPRLLKANARRKEACLR